MLLFVLTSPIQAAELSLHPSKTTISLDEQFYVDVMLDPQTTPINGVEGSISFSDGISFVRAETGKSIITSWINQPALKDTSISFSGIIANGFDGVINPFTPNQKSPGLIVRLVFAGQDSGNASIVSAPLTVTLNDGVGTSEVINPVSASVSVDTNENLFVYKNPKDQTPLLHASIVRDPNLFDGKYTLIFQATDAITGIKSVMIKEGGRDWKEIESPYLLEDQTRHDILYLQAINFSGASIITKIDPIPHPPMTASMISFIVAVISICAALLISFKKKYIHEK
jgi:hypothetical protein